NLFIVTLMAIVFQYPRLDRRVENNTFGVSPRFRLYVSVSTTGSKGRKPFRYAISHLLIECFSIHDWIEGSKTAGGRRPAPGHDRFSIHDWIEGSKTLYVFWRAQGIFD